MKNAFNRLSTIYEIFILCPDASNVEAKETRQLQLMQRLNPRRLGAPALHDDDGTRHPRRSPRERDLKILSRLGSRLQEINRGTI
jgi:hypothetical protein